ncbi:MAG TPA: MFS transporter [Gammaproteobacteria bacterium]|nr:MFS transporter [Gammaproteobacteria bacterium]
MPRILQRTASIFLGVAALGAGYGLMMTLVSVRLARGALTNGAIGAVTSVFFLGGIAGVWYSRWVIERVGHIRSFAAFAALLACVTVTHTLTANPWAWALLRGLAGFFFYALLLVAESWLNEETPPAARGRILAGYMIVYFLSQVAGQLLLNVADTGSRALFTLSAMLIVISLVPVSLVRSAQPRAIEARRLRFAELVRISPLAVTGCFVGGFLMSAYYAMAPVFGQRIGLSDSQISLMMASALAGGLLGQWPLGSWSDRVGRHRALAVVALAIVAGGLAGNLPHLPFWGLLGLMAGLGTALFSVYPLSNAQANDFVEPRHTVALGRGLLMVFGVGSVVAPLVVGVSMDLLGPGGLFAAVAAAGAVLELATLPARTLPRRLRRMSVYVSQGSVAAPGLDPRSGR